MEWGLMQPGPGLVCSAAAASLESSGCAQTDAGPCAKLRAPAGVCG